MTAPMCFSNCPYELLLGFGPGSFRPRSSPVRNAAHLVCVNTSEAAKKFIFMGCGRLDLGRGAGPLASVVVDQRQVVGGKVRGGVLVRGRDFDLLEQELKRRALEELGFAQASTILPRHRHRQFEILLP